MPAEQTSPAAQALPHAPQFALSEGTVDARCRRNRVDSRRCTQPAHSPAELPSPLAHAVPHAPQLALSVDVPTHVPLRLGRLAATARRVGGEPRVGAPGADDLHLGARAGVATRDDREAAQGEPRATRIEVVKRGASGSRSLFSGSVRRGAGLT